MSSDPLQSVDNPRSAVAPGAESGSSGADLTGRDRMAWNVVVGWVGHMVFVVGGFVMPRMIDRHLSQDLLGVWDFGWSIVSYFGLLFAGVTTSIGPYVARYRAARDIEELNATVSTAQTMYLGMAGLVVVAAVTVVILIPTVFGARLGHNVREAQWIVLLLGVSLAVQSLFTVTNGIITGCHRWDIHNAIGSGVYVLTVIGMIAALLLSHGLRTMAVVTVAGDTFSGLLRVLAARRICPEARFRWHKVKLRCVHELLGFGMKSVLDMVAYFVLYQTNSLLVVYYLGPAALAVYSRPMALIRHCKVLMRKFAYVITPTAGAMHGLQDRHSLRDLLVKSSQYSMYICLPMVMFMVIMGGPLLQVWMGKNYAKGWLLALMAVGHLLYYAHLSTYQLLLGLNRHGMPGVLMLVGAVVSTPMTLLCLQVSGLGLYGAALAVSVTQSVVWGVLIPWCACRAVSVPFWTLVVLPLCRSLAACTPFVAFLATVRLLYSDSPWTSITVGSAGGMIVLYVCYRWLAVKPCARGRVDIPSLVGLAFLRRARSRDPRDACPEGSNLDARNPRHSSPAAVE